MSRLISDSYMYRAIGAEINGACGKCSLSRSDCMGQSLSRMDVCGIIDDAPTVDAVPVVHGEWIPFQRPNGGYYTGCSICSFPMPTDSMCDFMDEADNRFCYNCGAKMDATQSNESNTLDALDGKEKEDG